MKYEFAGIVKPFLPEDVRDEVLKKLKSIIKKNKGTVEKEDIWGKRHLAYPINGHEEGYYIIYNLDLPQSKVETIQEEVRDLSDILRYMLMKSE